MRDAPVYLHVGLKKTGTSYLQTVFRAGRSELERQGLSMVPGSRPAAHQLALAVLGKDGVRSGDPIARLPRQLARATGDRCLISEESLAGADRSQIERLAGALRGREVHLVVTVRDIARTIPSAWQQTVKAGHERGFEDFVEAVVADSEGARGFWRTQGVLGVLDRWQVLVAPERIHVVVVPGPDAPPEELLSRFCHVVGLDPSALPREAARANESLGLPQAEVLRRVNGVLREHDLGREAHGDVVKRYLGLQILVPQGGQRPRLPARLEPWCRDHAAKVIEALDGGRHHVVGDLGDLEPPATAFVDHEQVVDETEVGDVAVRAVAALVLDRISAATPSPHDQAPPAQTAPPSARSAMMRRLRGLGRA